MTAGNFTLVGGFWAAVAAIQTPGAPWLTVSRTTTNTVAGFLATARRRLEAPGHHQPCRHAVCLDGRSSRLITPMPPTFTASSRARPARRIIGCINRNGGESRKQKANSRKRNAESKSRK